MPVIKIKRKPKPPVPVPAPVSSEHDVEMTNSSRSMVKNCPQKYFYAYEENLTPKDGKTFLVVGDIFHQGMEMILLKKKLSDIQAHTKNQIRINRKNFFGNPVKFEKDSSILEGMLYGYYNHQGLLKNATVPIINGQPAVEMKWAVDMGRGLMFRGKIDALVKLPDGYWLVEHKSSGRIDSQYIEKLPMNSQITTYLFAMKYVLPPAIADKVKGVIYNVVGKTGIRKKQKESPTAFLDRLHKEYMSTSNKTQLYFQRKMYRNAEAIRRFEIEAHATAEDVRRARKTGIWQQNESFCTYYSQCEFLPICTQGKVSNVMAMYTKRKNQHLELDEE